MPEDKPPEKKTFRDILRRNPMFRGLIGTEQPLSRDARHLEDLRLRRELAGLYGAAERNPLNFPLKKLTDIDRTKNRPPRK